MKDRTQMELAKILGISQPSVHERLERSHMEAIVLLEERFRECISALQTEIHA